VTESTQQLAAPAPRPLSDLLPGTQAVVSAVRGDASFITLLAARGLTIGAQLSVLRNSGHAPLLIMVRDTCLALGHSEAAWIEVELIAPGEEPAEPAH
jgi:Fe2+ transport system protein FeoA